MAHLPSHVHPTASYVCTPWVGENTRRFCQRMGDLFAIHEEAINHQFSFRFCIVAPFGLPSILRALFFLLS